jgi:catechol 2,3-dioxygenase-like lactoylglutathione lyase family enzyme
MEISKLKINSLNFEKQLSFYSNKIGLEIIKKSEFEVEFQIGKSKLSLIQSDDFTPYHFAINIPCNKEHEALEWLKERVEILKNNDHEIQDFASWNAKAMYFYDADYNIVEFIARKNLENISNRGFDTNSLIQISEIGMPVNDIQLAYSKIKHHSNLDIYDGSFERFCAIGDENGLFICINKHKKDWFPTCDKAYSSDFGITYTNNQKEHHMKFVSGYLISSY